MTMEATTLRRAFALLLSAGLLAGFMVASAVPVGAADDATPEPAVGVDALSGLSADLEGGGTSDPALTGDLDNPLAGGTGGTSDDADPDATGAEPGTTDSSKLMLDLILDDVQAAEAEAKMAGKTLTQTERTAVATGSVKDLITFLQETGLLGEVDKRELLKQIEGIPTEPEG